MTSPLLHRDLGAEARESPEVPVEAPATVHRHRRSRFVHRRHPLPELTSPSRANVQVMSTQQSHAWSADDPRLSRVWLRKELIASGLNDRAIATMVAAGELHRVRYGSYVSGDAWRRASPAQRHSILARAVVRRANADVVVSHTSAANEWEVALWDWPLDVVHLTRTDQSAGRREAGVLQHLGELRDGEVVMRNGMQSRARPAPPSTAHACSTSSMRSWSSATCSTVDSPPSRSSRRWRGS